MSLVGGLNESRTNMILVGEVEFGCLIAHTAPTRGMQPIRREIEEDNQTHVHFRNWYKFCVSAKSLNLPHREHQERDCSGVGGP